MPKGRQSLSVAISWFVNVCILFFATTLFFPFSEENKTLIEMKPSLFADTSLTNGAGLCRKNQPYGTFTSVANAVRPHEMRAQNGATILPGAYITTIA